MRDWVFTTLVVFGAVVVLLWGAHILDDLRFNEGHVLRWDSDRNFSCDSFTVYVRDDSLYDGKFVPKENSGLVVLRPIKDVGRYCEAEVRDKYSDWEFRVLSPGGKDLRTDTVVASLVQR